MSRTALPLIDPEPGSAAHPTVGSMNSKKSYNKRSASRAHSAMNGHTMKNLTPCHINETESDRRGIKDGWYAINGVGKLGCGPFGNREDCLSSINRQSAAIDPYHQWGQNT